MTASRAALIAAAGGGQRLGSGPKALVKLGGLTLLEHVIIALEGQVDEIVVAVPAEHVAATRRAHPEARVVAGGGSRQESVRAMLAVCRSYLVAVHDVARPFLTHEVLESAFAAAQRSGAASAAVPVADTVVELGTAVRGRTLETYGDVVDRDGLRAVQTPQAFRRELLARAHQEAQLSGRGATDDAGLVRAMGHDVELVAGSRLLFKITEPGDLLLAEALLARLGPVAGAGA